MESKRGFSGGQISANNVFSPRSMGKWSNMICAYFWNGWWKNPPTRSANHIRFCEICSVSILSSKVGLGSAVFIQVGIMSGSGCEAPHLTALIFLVLQLEKGIARSLSNLKCFKCNFVFLIKNTLFSLNRQEVHSHIHSWSLTARPLQTNGTGRRSGFLLRPGTIFRGYTP